jgi:beta-1,4-mannosyl-glycoprotein beta-1,4-N-acetylglucosaminyltransferase
MKIFDCTTFYNENLILEARFNILNEFVDKFVITESSYSHSGEKKDFNFDFSRFEKFKDKIIYFKIEEEPKDLTYCVKDGKKIEEGANIRLNAIKRIAHQRNFLNEGIIDASKDDLIFYSDNDEIPNLEFFDTHKIKNEIIIFNQKMFYYKFNLFYDRYEWFGTKGCKKKNLVDFNWLRNVKAKKYPFYRIDTFFSKTKYAEVNIIKNGGWHFSQLKKPEEIYKKLTNAEDHLEFKETKKTLSDIEDLVKRKVILYDHLARTSENKFNKEFKLTTLGVDQMPQYIQNNLIKYKDWLDFN